MFVVVIKVVAVNFDNKETGSDLKERDESCFQLRFSPSGSGAGGYNDVFVMNMLV